MKIEGVLDGLEFPLASWFVAVLKSLSGSELFMSSTGMNRFSFMSMLVDEVAGGLTVSAIFLKISHPVVGRVRFLVSGVLTVSSVRVKGACCCL